MSLLEVRNLVFRVNDRVVLDHLSLNIPPAEVYALLGTNGTGKSTLAAMVMGCEGYRPTEGEILFDGRIINDLTIHERAKLGISMAWQEPVRFEGLGVAEYLTLSDRSADAAHYLHLVGLGAIPLYQPEGGQIPQRRRAETD